MPPIDAPPMTPSHLTPAAAVGNRARPSGPKRRHSEGAGDRDRLADTRTGRQVQAGAAPGAFDRFERSPQAAASSAGAPEAVLGALPLRHLIESIAREGRDVALWPAAATAERAARHLQLLLHLQTIGATTVCSPELLARAQLRLRSGMRPLSAVAQTFGETGRAVWRLLKAYPGAIPPGVWLWLYLCANGRRAAPLGAGGEAVRHLNLGLPRGPALAVFCPPPQQLAALFVETVPAASKSWPLPDAVAAAETLLNQSGLVRTWPWPSGNGKAPAQRAAALAAAELTMAALGLGKTPFTSPPAAPVSSATHDGLIALQAVLADAYPQSERTRALLLPPRVAQMVLDPQSQLAQAQRLRPPLLRSPASVPDRAGLSAPIARAPASVSPQTVTAAAPAAVAQPPTMTTPPACERVDTVAAATAQSAALRPPELTSWPAWIDWCEAKETLSAADVGLIAQQTRKLERISIPLAHLRRWAQLWAAVPTRDKKLGRALWAPVQVALDQHASAARACTECQHVFDALAATRLARAYEFWSLVPASLADRFTPRHTLALLKAPPPSDEAGQLRLSWALAQAASDPTWAQHLCQAPTRPLLPCLEHAVLREAAAQCICHAAKPGRAMLDALRDCLQAHPPLLLRAASFAQLSPPGLQAIIEVVYVRMRAADVSEILALKAALSGRIEREILHDAGGEPPAPATAAAAVKSTPLLDLFSAELKMEVLIPVVHTCSTMLQKNPAHRGLHERMRAMLRRIETLVRSPEFRWNAAEPESFVEALTGLHLLASNAQPSQTESSATWRLIQENEVFAPSLADSGFTPLAAKLTELMISASLERPNGTGERTPTRLDAGAEAILVPALPKTIFAHPVLLARMLDIDTLLLPLMARLANKQRADRAATRRWERFKIMIGLSRNYRCALHACNGNLELDAAMVVHGHQVNFQDIDGLLTRRLALLPDAASQAMMLQYRSVESGALEVGHLAFNAAIHQLKALFDERAGTEVGAAEKRAVHLLCRLLEARHLAFPMAFAEEPMLDALALLQERPEAAPAVAEWVDRRLAELKGIPLPPACVIPCAWLACQVLPPQHALELSQRVLAAFGLTYQSEHLPALMQQAWTLPPLARSNLVAMFASAMLHGASDQEEGILFWSALQAQAAGSDSTFASRMVFQAHHAHAGLTPAKVAEIHALLHIQMASRPQNQPDGVLFAAVGSLNVLDEDLIESDSSTRSEAAMQQLLSWAARSPEHVSDERIATWRVFLQSDPSWTTTRTERLGCRDLRRMPIDGERQSLMDTVVSYLHRDQGASPAPGGADELSKLYALSQCMGAYEAVFRTGGRALLQQRFENLASWAVVPEELGALTHNDAQQWWYLLQGPSAREAMWATIEQTGDTRPEFTKLMLVMLDASVAMPANEVARALRIVDAMVLCGTWDDDARPSDAKSWAVWTQWMGGPRRRVSPRGK